MSSRSSRPAPAPSASRQNEYFVPRDGIDREVISADICRYLGNDALVRPGMYENGSVTPGYFITAYRNLTTAMIEDLKADSARWENERRAQSSRQSGGSFAPREMGGGPPARAASNSPIVSYHQSETHQSRQHYGPSEAPHPSQDPYGRNPYPGGGAPGHSGSASYQPGAPQPQGQPQPPYAGNNYSSYQQQGQKTNDGRYTSPAGGSMMPPPQGFQDNYVAVGANQPIAQRYGGDPYAGARTSAGPPQPVYATSAPSQPSYPATAPYSYGSQQAMHPQDYIGRGGQPGQQPQGFPQSSQQPQYSQPPPQQSHSSDRHRSSGRR